MWGGTTGQIPSGPSCSSSTPYPVRQDCSRKNRANSNCNIWWERHLFILFSYLEKQGNKELKLFTAGVYLSVLQWREDILHSFCPSVIKGFHQSKEAGSEIQIPDDKTFLDKKLLSEKNLLGNMKSIKSLSESGMSGVFSGQAVSQICFVRHTILCKSAESVLVMFSFKGAKASCNFLKWS